MNESITFSYVNAFVTSKKFIIVDYKGSYVSEVKRYE